jgi:hypothetical protein
MGLFPTEQAVALRGLFPAGCFLVLKALLASLALRGLPLFLLLDSLVLWV